MSRLVRLSLTGLSLCAGPALAQIAPPPVSFPEDALPFVVPWPNGIEPGPFRCIEPGDYDGNGTPDAAVLRGTKPVILLDPAILATALVLPCNVTDIACLRQGGVNGQDVVATVDASGLTLWDFDPAQVGPQVFTPRSAGSGAWAGALQVVGGDLDGDLDGDLLGLGSDGRTILFRTHEGGIFANLPSFLALAQVRELGLVEWDGDAAPEVWALTTKALEVYELTGARVANNRNFASTGQVDGVAVLRHPQPGSDTKDQIVWATRASATSLNQVLLVLFQGGYEPNPILLTNSGVVSMATADYDHDGDADLIMADKNLHVVRRVDNKRAQNHTQNPLPPTFEGYPAGIADYWAGTNPPNAPPNVCALPWIDWDNDGEFDVICVSEPETWVLLYPGIGIPEAQPEPHDPGDEEVIYSGHPAFISMEYFGASQWPCYGSLVTHGKLILHLNNPWNATPSENNCLDLIVYRQRDLDDDNPDNEALRHHRYPLNTIPSNNPNAVFEIPLMIPENQGCFEGRYFCQVRVILNPGPNQTVLRNFVGGFTSDIYTSNGLGSWTALMDLPFGWPGTISNTFDYCPDPNVPPGAVNGGGFRPLSRMPAFGEGLTPVPGDVTPWYPPPLEEQ